MNSITKERGRNKALNKLVEYELIQEVGRLDVPGRPILFGTSEEFLRCFNLSSISNLPDIELEYNFEGLNDDLADAKQIEFDSDKQDDFEIKTIE
mgnify:CR=1 FL=1